MVKIINSDNFVLNLTTVEHDRGHLVRKIPLYFEFSIKGLTVKD